MSTEVAQTESTTRAARLGTFTIVGRTTVAGAAPGQINLRVIGTDGGPMSGKQGIATCLAAPTDETLRSITAARLQAVQSTRHPALALILESAISGSVVWWVQEASGLETLPQRVAKIPATVSLVRGLIVDLGAALQLAHEADLSHGAISAECIHVQPDGRPTLFGLGLTGAGPEKDQRDLGVLAIKLLATRPWNEPDFADHPDTGRVELRAGYIRETLATTTERIARVLSRATEPLPENQYPTIAEFAKAFDEAVVYSAEDLVAAAFEAISARNPELATVMADKAELYDPTLQALALLKIQLHGGSLFPGPLSDAGPPPQPFDGVPIVSPLAPLTPSATGPDTFNMPGMLQSTQSPSARLPAELTDGLPAEFLESIAAQFDYQPVKKRMNPMLVLALGGVAVVVLMLIAVLVTIALPTN